MRRRLLRAGALVTIAVLAAGEVVARQLTARRLPDPTDHPAQHGLQYEEVLFRSRDGLPLRGWWLPAKTPRATLIVAPGLNGSLDSDLRYVPPLVDLQFNVLIFDFRGHGRSAGEVVSLGYNEVMDLRGALDWLEGCGLAGNVGLLGFSMGAAIALTTAARDSRIRAIVADSPFVRLHPVVTTAMLARGVPRGIADVLGWIGLWRAGIRAGGPLSLAEPDRWAADITQPVLLMHGGSDRLVSEVAIRRFAAKLAGPHEIWFVPEAGHRELDLVRPGEYLERIAEWFQRFLVGPGAHDSNDEEHRREFPDSSLGRTFRAHG